MKGMKKVTLFFSVVLAVVVVTAAFLSIKDKQRVISYVANIPHHVITTKDSEKKVSLVIGGDIMLDRNIARLAEKNNDFAFPFDTISSFLSGFDLRVANLEGGFTNFPSESVKNNITRFTFSPKFLDALRKNIDVVSLANNHSKDFGVDGFDQTRTYLDSSEILHFGNYDNTSNLLSVVVEKNGIRIAFVGYHALVGRGEQAVLDEISKIKSDADFVIVVPHWGIEYRGNASPDQIRLAHLFIDAGADAVIGAHPHVIEPIEIYNNKLILYSMGNFIFDQYFSAQTQEALLVSLDITKRDDDILSVYHFHPLQIDSTSRPALADDAHRSRILSDLAKNSSISQEQRNTLLNGSLLISR